MNEIIKTYAVKVVRERGAEPLTGQVHGRAEEDLTIDATSTQAAHTLAELLTTLKFRGQRMRVFINGEEHFDERF